jgi:nucleotide-binding universal stress UspA family protein
MGIDVLKGLESYIDAHPEIDMLVMIGHERRDWLENFVSPRLTKKVVHHPHLPTLIIKH